MICWAAASWSPAPAHEGARLIGYLSYAHPEPPGPDLATLASLAASGRLDPGVSLTLPWTHLRDVLTALTERRITGKAVLTLGLFRAEMVMGRKPHPA